MRSTGHHWNSVFPGVFHDFRFGWIVEISREWNAILPGDYFAHIEASETYTEAKESSERFPDAVVYSMLGDHVSIRRTADNALIAVIEITSAGQRDFEEQKGILIQRVTTWTAERAVVYVIDFFDVFKCVQVSQSISDSLRIITGNAMVRELPVEIDSTQSILFPLETSYWRAWQHLADPMKKLVQSKLA